MTNEELRDAAVVDINASVAGVNSASASLSSAVANLNLSLGLLAQIKNAPPPGALRWKPPGFVGGDPKSSANYPGYLVVDWPTGATLVTLDDTKDYFVRPFSQSYVASKLAGARSDCGFIGGRNIVMIGGYQNITNNNNRDDGCMMQFLGGDPTGVIHVEGVDFVATVNALTVRTGRTVRLQNCRMSANQTFGHDHSYVHPDIVQIWHSTTVGSPKIQMNRVTAYSDMTFLSCLESPDPSSWEAYDVNLVAIGAAGDGIYPQSGGQPHTVCRYTLSNVWFLPGGLYPKIDDHWGYTDKNTYTLTTADGTQTWASAVNQVGGSGSATPIGKATGDVWKCVESGAGLLNQTCRWGVPPAGDFVPVGLAGVGYVSPGYL